MAVIWYVPVTWESNYGPADGPTLVYAVPDTCLQSLQQCDQLSDVTVSSHTNQVTVSRNVFT